MELRNYTFSIAQSKIQLHYTIKTTIRIQRGDIRFFLSLLFENTLGEVHYMWHQIEVLRGDWWNTTVWTFQEVKCAVGSHQGWSRIHFNSISSGSNAYKCQIQRTRSISICFFKRTSRTELELVMSRSEMEQTPAQVPMLRVNWCEGEHCYSSWSLNHDLVS